MVGTPCVYRADGDQPFMTLDSSEFHDAELKSAVQCAWGGEGCPASVRRRVEEMFRRARSYRAATVFDLTNQPFRHRFGGDCGRSQLFRPAMASVRSSAAMITGPDRLYCATAPASGAKSFEMQQVCAMRDSLRGQFLAINQRTAGMASR